MENIGLGAGLASMAFWGFIAVVATAGIWDSVRKREAKHETVRRMIESGKDFDQELIDRLLSLGISGRKRIDRGFKITALWILPIAVGMVPFGLILGSQVPAAKMPLLGVSALMGCMGAGFWVASIVVKRWYEPDQESSD
jgi:hypothetical protein